MAGPGVRLHWNVSELAWRGKLAAWPWKRGSADRKSSSAGSVEKFQTLLAGLRRYPAISEDARRLLFGFFFSLALLFSPQKNKPNHRAAIMMVLLNISGYEYQIRSQAPEKSLFLLSQWPYLWSDFQKTALNVE